MHVQDHKNTSSDVNKIGCMRCTSGFFFLFVFFNGRHLSHRPLPATKAGSGDHFIMEAPDECSPLPPVKEWTILHPCLTLDWLVVGF